MSMDPSGTNRMISQQIKEWHAIVDQERTAKIVVETDAASQDARPSLRSFVRHGAGLISRPLAAVRHRLADRPVG
jgi:hypothetical protein